MDIPVRKMEPGDRSFIIRSWVTSMRAQYPFSAMSRSAIAKYSKRVEALIGIANVLVACDEINPDVVYGFIVYEDGEYLGRDSPTLHMIWVRKKFRNLGIGTHLMFSAFPTLPKIIFTHHTKDITRANLKEKWNLEEYDPYYIEGALYVQARKFDAKAICWNELTNPLRTAQATGRQTTGGNLE